MPNTKDDAPNPSSEDTPNPAEAAPSPDAGSPGDPSDKGKAATDTLENLASKQVQALMDRSQALMTEGRYPEMDPKVIQLLTTYDRLTQTPEGVGTGESPGKAATGPVDESTPAQRKSYDQLGREAQAKEALTKVTTKIEADVVKSMWAEEVRSLYAELGKTQVTTEQFASVDFTNHTKFPPTRAGFQTWMKAASTLRVDMAGGKGSTTGEDEDEDSGLDADRTKAGGGKKQPNPASAGAALTDIAKATERKKVGKLGGKEFLEIVRKGTSPGILD
jgi:hypothetical protein